MYNGNLFQSCIKMFAINVSISSIYNTTISLSLLLLLPVLLLASLEDAEDVDPEEAAGADVDDPQRGRHHQEVGGLGGQPEQAGALECWQQFLSRH